MAEFVEILSSDSVPGSLLRGPRTRSHAPQNRPHSVTLNEMARLLLLVVVALHAFHTTAVISFGTGNAGQVCLGRPVQLFEHQLSNSAHAGVMSHFWTTGTSEEEQAAQGVELMINYRFDGEATPSISFNPAKMAGQFFGAVQLPVGAPWTDGTRAATQNSSMFAAGDKMGKNALTSAWFNYYKLPFASTVEITASLSARSGNAPHAAASVQLYCIVRGHEIPLIFLNGHFVIQLRVSVMKNIHASKASEIEPRLGWQKVKALSCDVSSSFTQEHSIKLFPNLMEINDISRSVFGLFR